MSTISQPLSREERETTAREVPEWIGARPETPVPPRVRLRVFERYGGRCYLSGRLIRPGDAWDVEHILALVNGGENRESNMAPALRDKHRAKTVNDLALKSKNAKSRARHLGIKSKSSRGFSKTLRRRMDGTVERREP